MPSVANIVRAFLKENGYEGLYNSDSECACLVNDLYPGFDCPDGGCTPGYRAACDCGEGHQFHIVSGPPREPKHKIEMRVVDGDMAWMFYLSIDGEDVVRQFVTPEKGMILKEYIDERSENKKLCIEH